MQKTSTNASENHEQFYALKKQVDAVDDELDKLDDEFEYAYQMKEISFETYKARERAIEKLFENTICVFVRSNCCNSLIK